jgi:hypothetical protein
VQDPRAVLAEVCAFCHLRPAAAMVDAVAIEPSLNEELIRELDTDDVALITQVCGATMGALDYELRVWNGSISSSPLT